MNFGLSGYLGIALAVSLAAAAIAGWFALHEYGVASAQASRDRAQIAQVQAQATANALRQQQAIDKAEAATRAAMQTQAQKAIDWLRQLQATSGAQATTETQTVRTIIRREPATACARTCIPPAIGAQVPNWAVCRG